MQGFASGAVKLRLLAAGLEILRAYSPTIAIANYISLAATGQEADYVFAFARIGDGFAVILVVPRLVLRLVEQESLPLNPSECWGDTRVELPDALKGATFHNAITGAVIEPRGQLHMRQVLAEFPMAILAR